MKKTCGNCRFKTFDDSIPEGFFLCGRIKHYNNDDNSNRYALKTDNAVVEDGSGYHAALCIKTDFGCNLHEQ